MVLQAFIDDSVTPGGTFVLAGFIASAEAWANFSKEWEELLPLTMKGSSGKHRFKMNEMAHYMDRVPAFYSVIEKHVVFTLSCKIDVGELERAIDRISVDNTFISFNDFRDPYLMAFRGLMDTFHDNRLINERADIVEKILPLDQQIDFYFDNQSSKKAILSAWDEYVENRRDEVRGLYGATPRFEDDEIFMPLQAADFWAWWVRKGYDEDRVDEIMNKDFGYWKGNKHIPGFEISFTEDQLVAALMILLRREVMPGRVIVDRGYPVSLLARLRRFIQRL